MKPKLRTPSASQTHSLLFGVLFIVSCTADPFGTGGRNGPLDGSFVDTSSVERDVGQPARFDSGGKLNLENLTVEELLQIWCEKANICTELFACPGPTAQTVGRLGVHDVTGCRELYALDRRECAVLADHRRGAIVVNEDILRYCIKNERYCGNCPGAITGAGTQDSPCFLDRECRGDLHCAAPFVEGCRSPAGTCQPLALPGESCFERDCREPARCRVGYCESPSVLGGRCRAGSCEKGAICNINDRVCVPLPAEGEECLPREFWQVCDEDLVCIGETCTERAKVGEPCGVDIGLCDQLTYCGDDGTCAPRHDDGEPCSTRYHCHEGLECQDSVCARVGYIGQTCPRSGCLSDFASCEENRCVPNRFIGTSCSEPGFWACIEGACDDGTCVPVWEAEICAATTTSP